MMNQINIGIVGLGRLGIEHAKNLAFKIPNANLIALCALEEDLLSKYQKEWNIEYAYTDYYKMIENEDLDAVAIISPSPLHVEILRQRMRKIFMSL